MDFRRLFDIFSYQQAKYPQKKALSTKLSNQWYSYSTADVLNQIDRVSAGLLNLGLKRGDKMAIIAPAGNPKWNFLDFGMQQIGVVVVPIHATISTADLIYILNNAAIKHCVVFGKILLEKIENIRDEVPTLKAVYMAENGTDTPGWKSLTALPTDEHLAKIVGLKAAIHEEDLATIIYTSGTTGMPKGVMLSHKNIVSNIKSIIPLIPLNCDKRTLSFLPLSHIFERMVTYTYMAVGASIYYSGTMDNLRKMLQEVKPHYFASVPRLLEKMYDRLNEESLNRNKLFQVIYRWAIRIGQQYNGKRNMGLVYWFKLTIADILVFSFWRRAMGRKVEGIVVGAAALQPKLGRLFSAAGIDIREGYGMTETAPVIAFNRFEPGGVHFGTVGIPVPGVQIKIDPSKGGEEEGEILVKGPNVMMGYYNEPEKTAEVLQDRWFRTGDIGKIVHKRFLQITDRKKDIFKTSSGKYIAPQRIEKELATSPFIESGMVVGFSRPYVTALIVPSYTTLQKWCKDHNVHWTSPQFMAINPKVTKLMDHVVEEINNDLANNEKIRKIYLLHEPWSVTSGEYTPTLKLKRSYIEEKYQEAIDEMYKSA